MIGQILLAVLVTAAALAVPAASGPARRRLQRWRLRRAVTTQVLDLLATPEGRAYLHGLRAAVKGRDLQMPAALEGRYLQLLAAPYGDDGDHDQEMTR